MLHQPFSGRSNPMTPPVTNDTLAQTDYSLASHSHHWVIEEPSGPTSRGRCRVCNAEQEFRNWPNPEVMERQTYAA